MKGIKSTLLFLFVCVCLTTCNHSTKSSGSTGNDDTQPTVVNAETTAEKVVYEHGYIVKVGDQAPDFIIEYTDGHSVRLSDLKGKLVMLQFTASWCGVCRKEMPYIEKDIWQKHKSNPDFALIGIDLKENRETTEKFANDIKVTYPLTLDPDGSRFALFTAPNAGVTRNIIIDKTGKIVMLTRLFEMEEFNGMVKFIDEYLAKNE